MDFTMYPGRKSLEVSNVFVPQDWRFPSVIKFFLGFYIKIDMCRVLCLARLPINFNKWSLVKGAFLSNSMFFFYFLSKISNRNLFLFPAQRHLLYYFEVFSLFQSHKMLDFCDRLCFVSKSRRCLCCWIGNKCNNVHLK